MKLNERSLNRKLTWQEILEQEEAMISKIRHASSVPGNIQS